jgi:hypothetical protein
MTLGDLPLGDVPLASLSDVGVFGPDAVLSAEIRSAPRFAGRPESEPRFDADLRTEPEA